MSDPGEKPLLVRSVTGTSKAVEDTGAMAASPGPAPPSRRPWWHWAALVAATLLLVGVITGLAVGLQKRNAGGNGGASSLTAVNTSSGSAVVPETLTLYISAEQKDCTGMMPMKCLQVKTDLSQPYTLFHGDIRNFTYEPGYAYTLRVSKTEVPNPPADGASFYYTCLEVLAKVELAKEFPQLLPFEGTLWTLSGFPASGRQIVASPRGPPTLKVQDGHATGLASVNQYSAVVSISGNTITVGNVGTTRMMGPENLMEQEAYFVSALGNCTTFRVHAEQNIVILELSDAQGQVLLAFDGPKSAPTPAPDPMPASLLGTSWVLTSLNGSTPIERAPTLFFSDSEPVRVSGTSTINHYSGSVDITGSSISFGKNIASTMMAGPPEQMEQESLYFKALTSVASYALRTRADGSQLDMRDSEGNLVLVFKQTKA